jgi:hypothetical protein
VGVSDIGQVSKLFYVTLVTKNTWNHPFCYKGEVLKDTEQKTFTKEFIHDPVKTQDLACFMFDIKTYHFVYHFV